MPTSTKPVVSIAEPKKNMYNILENQIDAMHTRCTGAYSTFIIYVWRDCWPGRYFSAPVQEWKKIMSPPVQGWKQFWPPKNPRSSDVNSVTTINIDNRQVWTPMSVPLHILSWNDMQYKKKQNFMSLYRTFETTHVEIWRKDKTFVWNSNNLDVNIHRGT